MSNLDPQPTPEATRERRQSYRATVIPLSALRVRVWRIPFGVPLNRRPMPSQELRVGVWQVCVGGLTVAVGGPDDLHGQVSTKDRLRIEILYRDHGALVEGRLRDVPAPGADGTAAGQTGVVFQGRDADIVFRAAKASLSKIVGYVQREELRHRRDNPTPNTSAAA